MKDHEIAKLVNDLRDIAVEFGQTQQLRERIHRRLVPEIETLRAYFIEAMKQNSIRHDQKVAEFRDEIKSLRTTLQQLEEKKKTLKAIRKAAREGRIVLSEQDRIGAFTEAQVAGFIDTIWGGKALVTDESQISDFCSYGFDLAERAKAEQDCCTRIFEIYGVTCEPHEYLWQVLERIYK
jgi:hypothetical protein